MHNKKIKARVLALVISIAVVFSFSLTGCEDFLGLNKDKNNSTSASDNSSESSDSLSEANDSSQPDDSSETTTKPAVTTAPSAKTTAPTTPKATDPTKARTTATTTKTKAGSTGGTLAPKALTTAQKLAVYKFSSAPLSVYSVYNEIVQGIKNHQTTITFSKKIPQADFSKVLSAIQYSESMYSYLLLNEQDGDITYDGSANVGYVKFKYKYSKATSDEMTKDLQNKVNYIANEALKKKTDFEQIKYIHDYIIQNCTYNKDTSNSYDAYGALINKATACEGYSKAMALLCNQIGIECVPVTGSDKYSGIGHMWNMIKCNGNWYHMDVTYDDPVDKYGKDAFGSLYVGYDYFNITTAQVKLDHVIGDANKQYDNPYTVPTATATEGNYFVYNKALATSYNEAVKKLTAQMEKAANAKADRVVIQLSTFDLYKSTMTKLITNKEIFGIINTVNKTSKNKINLKSYISLPQEGEPCQNVITIFLKY